MCVYVYKYIHIYKNRLIVCFFCEKQAPFIIQWDRCLFDQWLNKMHQQTDLWLIFFLKTRSWHTSKVISVQIHRKPQASKTYVICWPVMKCDTVIIAFKSNIVPKTCMVEDIGSHHLGFATSCGTRNMWRTLKSCSCFSLGGLFLLSPVLGKNTCLRCRFLEAFNKRNLIAWVRPQLLNVFNWNAPSRQRFSRLYCVHLVDGHRHNGFFFKTSHTVSCNF